MRKRTLLLAVTLVAATQAGASQAAACPLVTDARGDSTPVVWDHPTPLDGELGSRETDLLSADAWTEKDVLHAVIRVAHLPEAGVRPFGHMWDLTLIGEEKRLHVVTSEGNGNYAVSAYVEELAGSEEAGAGAVTNLRGAEGTRSYATDTLHMTFPLGLAAPHMKVDRGIPLRPDVRSFRVTGAPSFRVPFAYLGPGGVGTQADVAKGKRTMRVGRAECVVRRR